MKEAIGIDIGGTGIKMAVVNLQNGELTTSKLRRPTPPGAHPSDVREVIHDMLRELDRKDLPIGVGFPCKVIGNTCHTAVNISQEWLGKNLVEYLGDGLDQPLFVANDADVAGIAELAFGDEELQRKPYVLFLTLGTGIGSVIFNHGHMVANTELGLLRFKGDIIERYASNFRRKEEGLSWKKWGKRLNKALNHFYRVLTPDIIVLGGGVSKKFEKFEPYLELEVPVRPATLQNDAGIIGAALLTM